MRTFRVTYRTFATADIELDDTEVFEDGTPDIDALYAALDYELPAYMGGVDIVDYRSVE